MRSVSASGTCPENTFTGAPPRRATRRLIVNNAYAMAGVLGYTEADRVCIPVPLYHCFGMGAGNLGCVTSGSTMVYPAATFEPFDAADSAGDPAAAEEAREQAFENADGPESEAAEASSAAVACRGHCGAGWRNRMSECRAASRRWDRY